MSIFVCIKYTLRELQRKGNLLTRMTVHILTAQYAYAIPTAVAREEESRSGGEAES